MAEKNKIGKEKAMKEKKWMALVLAGAMAVSLLAGCGNSKGETNGGTDVKEKKYVQSDVVSTMFGDVKGTMIEDTEIMAWYHIPYGAEPVGELRWKAPSDPENWGEVMDCTEIGEQALQGSGEEAVGTTDCLNLDVYAPTENDGKLPVLVFFHGGNNQTGSTQGDLKGYALAERNSCIVVNVNYRLGLLGFNCLPVLQTEEGTSGNYGFLDMARSLEWVRDNIESFGGDANNVTISGHSAGGRDVMAMLISPTFEGLFQKAIVSSGGMTVADVELSQKKIASFIAPLAVEDGKAATEEDAAAWLLTTSEDVKEYLYSISEERLMLAVGGASIRMSAFPHLFADGVTIPEEGFDTENYNDVPVLLTTGSDEFSMFNSGKVYEDGTIAEEELSAARAFGQKYGSEMYGYFNAIESAQRMKKAGYDAPIYALKCDFGHDSSKMPGFALGAYHGIIISFLEPTSGLRSAFADSFGSEGGKQLTDMLNDYVKNFMDSKDGNPNGDNLTAWEQYDSAKEQYMVLDATKDSATAQMEDVLISSYQQVFEEMDVDTTISESAKKAVIAHVMNGRWFSTELDAHYGNADLWN